MCNARPRGCTAGQGGGGPYTHVCPPLPTRVTRDVGNSKGDGGGLVLMVCGRGAEACRFNSRNACMAKEDGETGDSR